MATILILLLTFHFVNAETIVEKEKSKELKTQLNTITKELQKTLVETTKLLNEYEKSPEFVRQSEKYSVVLKMLNGLSDADIKKITQDNPKSTNPLISLFLRYGKQLTCTVDEVRKIKDELGPKQFQEFGNSLDFGSLFEYVEYSQDYIKRFRSLISDSKKNDYNVELVFLIDEWRPEDASLEKLKNMLENDDIPKLAKLAGISNQAAKKKVIAFSSKYKACLGYPYSRDYSKLRQQVISESQEK